MHREHQSELPYAVPWYFRDFEQLTVHRTNCNRDDFGLPTTLYGILVYRKPRANFYRDGVLRQGTAYGL